MTFDVTERALLACLADVFIPADEGFPSASEAGVANEGLDQVLSVRPELAAALKKLVVSARGRHSAEFVAELETKDPGSFGLLTELVAGAYFLNPQVRLKLGYQGQDPRPIDPHPDYLDEGLLQSVIDRGPIYRPTPEDGK